MNVAIRMDDRFVTVDGLKVRYLEQGSGVPAIFVHGSSLGSSADVFRRNLPALEVEGAKVGGREDAAQARLEERMVRKEPSLADTRALLEANLFNHDLITEDELQLRHQNSIGACFEQFTARHAKTQSSNKAKAGNESEPLWQRYGELKMPHLLIYGRNDRGRAGERAVLLKQ